MTERDMAVAVESLRAGQGHGEAMAEAAIRALGIHVDGYSMDKVLKALAPFLASQTPGEGWMPIESAPEGVRVLLGPRDAPVVGTVSHPVEWQEGETFCCVVHYNGNTLVANYHCEEWHPLPKPPATPTGAQS